MDTFEKHAVRVTSFAEPPLRKMRLVALCFVLGLALGGTHALGASDARRAAQQVPRDAFRGHDRVDTNRVLSRALRQFKW